MSTPQTQTTIVVFDYLLDSQGNAINNVEVSCTLQYELPVTQSPEPVVTLIPMRIITRTDANGYYQFAVVPNANITPTGTTYQIRTETTTVQIVVPGTGGPYQVSSILVSQPPALTPAGQTVGALTVTGLLTSQDGILNSGAPISSSAGLDVTGGGATIAGGETVDTLTATGQISADGGLVAQQATATSLALTIKALAAALGSQILFQLIDHTGNPNVSVYDDGNIQAAGTLQMDGQITGLAGLQITGLTGLVGEIDLGGHLVSVLGGTPVLTNIASGWTASIVGNDTRGTVTFTFAATNATAFERMATVTFASAYSAMPYVQLTFVGVVGSVAGAISVANQGAASFDIVNVTTQGASFQVNYLVIG